MRDIDKEKEQLVAELEEARQRIRELELAQLAEKNYYQFLKNLHEGIWVLDKDDRTTFVNPRMAEMLGYTEDEMLGQPVFSFMDEEWAKITTTHMARRKQGITEQVEAELLRKDGERVYALLEASQILDNKGNYIGSIAGVQDITARKQLEEQIRQQNDYLTEILESLPHPFYVVDANDYTIKMANSAAEFDNISKGPTCYALTHGSSVPCTSVDHLCPLEEIKKTKSPVLVEHIHYDKKGNPINVEVHAYPIFNKEGSVIEVIEYALDITERKNMEKVQAEQAATLVRTEELQRSRQRIVTAQEVLRRDIAQQIHGSVQNRLVVLLHQLEELQQTTSSSDISSRLNNICQAIKDLLENQLRPIAYQLYPAILRRGLVASLLSLKDRLETSLDVEMVVDDDIAQQERNNHAYIPEPVRLTAYRITEEALGNVIKHANTRNVILSLKFSSAGLLYLSIQDYGQGYDTSAVQGGLGIQFMQDYAELVGGSCEISSTLGKGTQITAILPLANTVE